MSIRDELSALITRISDAYVDADNADFHEDIADAILARYGVVELPEPIAQSGAGTGEWRPDEATTIFAYCGHVEFDGRDAWYESPAPARALAAALLAAANRAEATDVDR